MEVDKESSPSHMFKIISQAQEDAVAAGRQTGDCENTEIQIPWEVNAAHAVAWLVSSSADGWLTFLISLLQAVNLKEGELSISKPDAWNCSTPGTYTEK